MIIFDLDCLTDSTQRQHYIDPKKNDDVIWWNDPACFEGNYIKNNLPWRPDYASYEEASVDDKPITSIEKVMIDLPHNDVEIWTSRSEIYRSITMNWMMKNDLDFWNVKMRPNGDDTPQEVLFERWLFENYNPSDDIIRHNIDMVFSSHKPTIQMFRHMGVFVFDCNQGD
jgi:hypothetical protein